MQNYFKCTEAVSPSLWGSVANLLNARDSACLHTSVSLNFYGFVIPKKNVTVKKKGTAPNASTQTVWGLKKKRVSDIWTHLFIRNYEFTYFPGIAYELIEYQELYFFHLP